MAGPRIDVVRGEPSQPLRDQVDDRIAAILQPLGQAASPGGGLLDDDPPVDHEDDPAGSVVAQRHEEHRDVDGGCLARRGGKVEQVRPPSRRCDTFEQVLLPRERRRRPAR